LIKNLCTAGLSQPANKYTWQIEQSNVLVNKYFVEENLKVLPVETTGGQSEQMTEPFQTSSTWNNDTN
jgi:hypothetical protein